MRDFWDILMAEQGVTEIVKASGDGPDYNNNGDVIIGEIVEE